MQYLTDKSLPLQNLTQITPQFMADCSPEQLGLLATLMLING